MAQISRVAGATLLALAAAVQMSGGTATGGVSASAQGFPGSGPARGGGRFGGVRPPLALVEKFDNLHDMLAGIANGYYG